MECAYYFGWTAHGMCLLLWVDGIWNVTTTLGGRHLECDYTFCSRAFLAAMND
jgi:hypothetical protein